MNNLPKRRGIYKITASNSSLVYHGQAENIHDRWEQHLRDLDSGNDNSHLVAIWKGAIPATLECLVVKEVPYATDSLYKKGESTNLTDWEDFYVKQTGIWPNSFNERFPKGT